MSTVSQVETGTSGSIYETAQSVAGDRIQKETQTQKKAAVTGMTIGEPKLSEKAAKYYEELKKKYSNMDFILVSEDMKEVAKAQAGSYANANRMVVLIDEEKIERMAEDENYRRQYESIISSAAVQLSQIASSPASSHVKTYGMQVNDGGTASFFAVVDKSLAAQRERIEKNHEKKAEEKKKAAKKEAKEAAEEKRARKADDKRKAERTEESEDTVTVTASSVEELLKKIEDTYFAGMSDWVWTENEKTLGQNIDFRG